MKGVLLAGGTGSRLSPLTKITNKHLLPVYDRPMIYYPIETLRKAGITEILLIAGKGHAGDFLELLGSGQELGVHLSYEVQEHPGGIAHALKMAEAFVDGEAFTVVLGDNVYCDSLSEQIQGFATSGNGAHVFLKEVEHPESYGVARFDEEGRLVEIVEKPSNPPSSYAVTGCYCYEPGVFDLLRHIQPSARGEMEISDVNDHYAKSGRLSHSILQDFWGDCGESIDGLLEVSYMLKQRV
jgi:glucose-1-phosphate thymidylyltransferase